MAYIGHNEESEQIVSRHDERRWRSRDAELARWIARPKPKKRPKQVVRLGHAEIDAELLTALTLLQHLGIETEFSCAGVSMLDEPEDHSLYAYITFPASERTEAFIRLAMERMRHRLLVTFEPWRNRYDLSSFYIGHNRSFCLLMESCARAMTEAEEGEAPKLR